MIELTSPARRRRAGFTLVELLVVIGIIALLISILLPALNKARGAANTTKCLANLRTIGQAMQIYVNSSKGWIPGAGNTTGRYLYDAAYAATTVSATTIPPGMPIEYADFITPLASSMNVKFNQTDNPVAAQRYIEQANNKYFQCPSNDSALAIVNTTDPAAVAAALGTIPVISYTSALGFLLTTASPTPGVTGVTRISSGTGWPVYPGGFGPNIAKVGSSSTKIFVADGAKYTFKGSPQEYGLDPRPITSASSGNQGKYTDWGGWTITMTGSYDQWHASTAGNVDGRLASFRHGTTKNGGKAGTYKMNAVFYDGHCETIDDLAATNPSYWLPRGASFAAGVDTKIDPAVVARWGINATSYRVP